MRRIYMQNTKYSEELIKSLNEDIKQFPAVFPIEKGMEKTRSGISRMVMLDRYTFKDSEKKTLKTGDLVVVTAVEDPTFPVRAIGHVLSIDGRKITIQVEDEYKGALKDENEAETGIITRQTDLVDKPLEIYYEQIARRNAFGLVQVEKEEKQASMFARFYKVLSEDRLVPAGRVLYGAGSGTEVTYFNCYVMPFIADNRGGIGEHRKEVMEIMSRGGGVGTNGSTLRPKGALARSVNGKASGAVSWLDDIAQLTHLVEQGGSRRGAQMIMLADWHPDIFEFVISKMQKPMILRHLAENGANDIIRQLAKNKLKFTPYDAVELELYKSFVSSSEALGVTSGPKYEMAKKKLDDGGLYQVNKPDFLSGANISVCFTKEFMEAVENDGMYELRFPDVENYTKEEMEYYNEHWHEIGDVREWEALGFGIKTYETIRAKDLWDLINICATYSAEPGVFFIDNANDMTNAKAYGQKVVATNPCGEQPLAPYSVCNLAAINLAEMADKEKKEVNFELLEETVRTSVRLQDNVIDSTPYFLDANKKQALGERRVGLGVMGLHDLLIYCEVEYGSKEGNELVEQIFKCIAITAYEESIEISKEKYSFPFLLGDTTEETMELRNAFVNTGFMKKMPEHIRQGVLEHGIRNSHLLTVAPTGSTGTMIGVSTGLEPYFSFSYFRSGRLGKFIEVNADIVQEYIDANPGVTKDKLPNWFVTAMELSPEAHADTQCVIQRWVDSSLSKTVNAPKGYAVDQVEKVYQRLYKGGAKGGTVYVDGSRDSQVLTLTAEENNMDTVEVSPRFEGEKLVSVSVVAQNAKIGVEPGDICPVCEKGVVEELGGCTTCTNCKTQLKCGL
jgi:ribonucleoside-diphosphate reductase alpha chain